MRGWCSIALVLTGCSSDTAPAPVATTAPTVTVSANASAPDAGVDVHSGASPHAAPSGAPSAQPVEPVIADGSVDGAKLRARIEKRLREDRSPVVLLRGSSPRALGEAICERVVPRRPAATPILIKPNIGGFDWFKDPEDNDGDDGFSGRTTNPELVRGVITCLKKRGHERITIADGWGAAPKHWSLLMEKTGYGALAKEMSVDIVSLADDGHFDTIDGTPGKPLKVTGMERTRVPNLLMPKILAEHLERGLVISVPKLKAHRFAVMSGGIKGMQGTIMLTNARPAYQQKWRMHAELQDVLELKKNRDPKLARAYVDALNAFSFRLADVLAVEAPDVVLMDAAPAMGGDGFHTMVPSAELMAVGGTNPIAVDRVGAELLGLWKHKRLKTLLTHHTSPIITVAAKKYGVDLDAVVVEGNGAELLAGRRAAHLKCMAGFTIDTAAVPARIARAVKLRGDETIRMDGKADDAVWARAEPVKFSTDHAGVDQGIATSVRFAWSPTALHALWELSGAGFNVDTARPTTAEREELHEEDCVEIFLDPTPSTPKQYLEIQAGPLGHFHDVGVDLEKKAFDAGWSAQLQVATTRSGDTAIIEMRMSAPEVRLVLKAGKRVPMGLFRIEGTSPRTYLAWSPGEKKRPNFHQPDTFGSLLLTE